MDDQTTPDIIDIDDEDLDEVETPVRESWTFSIPKPRLSRLTPKTKAIAIGVGSAIVGATAVVLLGKKYHDTDTLNADGWELDSDDQPLELESSSDDSDSDTTIPQD